MYIYEYDMKEKQVKYFGKIIITQEEMVEGE